ncbi:MAG TPA: glycerol-3-phosphate dehydrogenase [Pyrinomonadaceae bacterium]|nr:glycerol-3-phosphate dehydrogenase [Pyrinomonadaceae bacterium]
MNNSSSSNIPSVEFDLVIIGAGINGAGVARDAAMRGLKVLLLDKSDLCAGTTAWSTRLIHGGLRYLEHGEVGLVRESLREREILMRIAPHLVKPLPILVPVFANRSRGAWTIRAGMILYDLLSFDKTLSSHRRLSRQETLTYAPGLCPQGLKSAVLYYDAQVELAERLVVENALSAQQNGALVHTYSQVEDLLIQDGTVRGVRFSDQLTGKNQEAACRLVINASGPWVDQLLERIGVSAARLLGGTKGSHLIVAPFSGAPDSAIYVEAEQDHRPFFIIPWNGNYLIGTTDIRYEGSLERLEISDGEVEYLLSETNRLIPAAQLSRKSILYSYSGVRPLPFSSEKGEQGITRRHFIVEHPEAPGLISLIGGKITTYRSLAGEVVDLCLRRLRRRAISCRTATELLPGAPSSGLPPLHEDLKSLSSNAAGRLLNIYGSRSYGILELTREEPELLRVFDVETGAIAAEIVFAFKSEMARTLTDCLIRRTVVGLNSTCGLDAVEAAAGIARARLGWSADRVSLEVESYQRYVERFRPQFLDNYPIPGSLRN